MISPAVRRLRTVALFAIAVSTSGCAHLFRQYDLAPNGLPRGQDGLRRMLATGRADSAYARIERSDDSAPSDSLLRLLFGGLSGHYAGRYAESNGLLEGAATLADDRATLSLSRTALSVITSDRVVPYEPSRAERLLIPYYAALNYLRLDDVEGAAVEARRLTLVLRRFEDEHAGDDASLHATLHYFAGTVFEAAGESNDADVSYRRAGELSAAPAPAPDTAQTDGSGEVVVIVENGFVAHRVEEAVMVYLLPEEVRALTGGDTGDRATTAALVAGRVLAYAASPFDMYATGRRMLYVPAPPRPRDHCADGLDGGGSVTCSDDPEGDERTDRDAGHENPYLLKVAWPSLRATRRLAATAEIVTGIGATPVNAFTDVSAAVAGDFDGQRATLLARAIARAALKLALTRAAEKKAGEQDETAGRIVGALANAGAVLLEQADTRSWHLLPAQIGMVRLRLPAGEQSLHLDAGDGGGVSRALDLGTVMVRAGKVTIVSARTW